MTPRSQHENTPKQRLRRIELAQAAIVDALAHFQFEKYEEALILIGIATVHLSRIADVEAACEMAQKATGKAHDAESDGASTDG